METPINVNYLGELFFSLYSLEKLIEWKLVRAALAAAFLVDVVTLALYSLEKLIEWKLFCQLCTSFIVFLSTR